MQGLLDSLELGQVCPAPGPDEFLFAGCHQWVNTMFESIESVLNIGSSMRSAIEMMIDRALRQHTWGCCNVYAYCNW